LYIMLERILELLFEQKRSQRELAEFLGVNQQTITDWKSGKTRTYERMMPEIAEFFGISTELLISREPSLAALNQLSEDEQKLLDTYRSLEEDDRYIALANLIQYARAVSGEKENPIRVPDGDVDGDGVLPPSGGMVGSGVKRS